MPLGDEVEAFLNGAQHAEAQQVDLHEPRIGAGVLVPLADTPALHGRGHHRHQFHQWRCAHHHAARVLGEVPRQPRGLARQRCQRPPATRLQAFIPARHAAYLVLHRIGGRPAVRQPGQPLDVGRGQGQRGAQFADGHAGAEGGEGPHQRRVLVAVAPDDLLDEPCTHVAREVEVDVGHRSQVLVEEPAEEESAVDGVDV